MAGGTVARIAVASLIRRDAADGSIRDTSIWCLNNPSDSRLASRIFCCLRIPLRQTSRSYKTHLRTLTAVSARLFNSFQLLTLLRYVNDNGTVEFISGTVVGTVGKRLSYKN